MSQLVDQQAEFTQMVGRLIAFAGEHQYQLRFGDAFRSTDSLTCPHCQRTVTYQGLLQANGRSKVAYSKHNDRKAVDFVIAKLDGEMNDQDYRVLGEYWESLGGRWGGRFGVAKAEFGARLGWDKNHFELSV